MRDETQARAADAPGDPIIGSPETDLSAWVGPTSPMSPDSPTYGDPYDTTREEGTLSDE